MERRFSHLPCQFCVGKTHCAQCGEDLEGLLRSQPGVTTAAVNMKKKTLTLEADPAALDDIFDAMENVGMFIE